MAFLISNKYYFCLVEKIFGGKIKELHETQWKKKEIYSK